MEFRTAPKIVKDLVYFMLNISLIPLVIFLFITKYVFQIQFIRIKDGRIGHLAAENDLFLRRLKLGIIKKSRVKYIGIASTNPSNKQLLKMFKRKLNIIQIPQPKLLNFLFSFMANHSILKKMRLFYAFPYNLNEYYEFNNAKSNLEFTESEKEKGKRLLKKLNINDNWFICFHARDLAYLNKIFKKNEINYNDYRNWDINDALKAIEYITSKGGFAVRMGIVVEKKLPKLKNPRIVDYATKYRTDFGDIYLPVKCKFFLGDGCGIHMISKIFNRPVAWVNLIPMKFPPIGKNDVFIVKKIWSIEKKRLLTFKEIINSEIIDYEWAELYTKAKLKVIDNTPKEILDLTIEANERLDGIWKTTKEDEKLQKKYKSLFKKGSHCYGFPSRIGTKFLRENKELLN